MLQYYTFAKKRHAALLLLRLIEKERERRKENITQRIGIYLALFSLRERIEAIKKEKTSTTPTSMHLLCCCSCCCCCLVSERLPSWTVRFCSLDLRCGYAKNMNSG